MLNIRFAAMAIVALAVLSLTTMAQQPAAGGAIPDGKVVVVNTTVFPEKIGELKQKYDQVEAKFKDRVQQLQSLADQIDKEQKEMMAQQNVLPADKLRDKQDRIETLKKQGTRTQEDLKADYDKELEAATKPVRDKLFQALTKYATRNSIVMVFSLAGAAQSNTLAFWDPKADITDDFVAEYNKANPVPAGAPAPTNPATKPAAVKPTTTTGKPTSNQ